MFLAPVSLQPEVAAEWNPTPPTCIFFLTFPFLQLLSVTWILFSTFPSTLSFTFPTQTTLVPPCSYLSYTEEQNLFSISVVLMFIDIQFVAPKQLKNIVAAFLLLPPIFIANPCKTEHIFKVAIFRYNLVETPIYKPSLWGCEPVFHTCQTKLISALSFSSCVYLCLAQTHMKYSRMDREDWPLPDVIHTRHTAEERWIKFSNVSAKVELQWGEHGCLTSGTWTSVSFVTAWGGR